MSRGKDDPVDKAEVEKMWPRMLKTREEDLAGKVRRH
jgi:hypothetical protein